MSNVTPQDEQLSAFCDGELTEDEARFLIRRLGHDRELGERYERYMTIGMVLRSEKRLAMTGFSNAVSARLGAAPASPRVPAWLRAVAGGAIAASVAAITLATLTPPAAEAPASRPTLAETTGLRASDMSPPVPLERVTERQSFTLPVTVPATPVNAQVESYFLRHSGATWSSARGGYVPYVYVVATPPRAARAQERAGASR